MSKPQLTDKELILSIKSAAKKEQGIKEFSAAHIGFIYKICNSLGIDEFYAKDVYTDSLIAFMQQIELGQFKGQSKASTYFYRIFYNKSVDFLRKQSTNKIDYMDTVPDRNTTNPFYLTFENKEEVSRISIALKKMGNPCKTILKEWAFLGYKINEIAQRNNYGNADQVKRKKYTCLEALRRQLNIKKA
jgi:RNA polymerase sigma factor (sigma-70 family)